MLLAGGILLAATWFVVAHLPPPERPGSKDFFREPVVGPGGVVGGEERLIARSWWKDDDHGWRFWERYHFAYNNYLRVWERGGSGEGPGVRGLSQAEAEVLADRIGGGPEEVLARAGLAVGEGRVLRVVYGREPDLFPWYRNPIHRICADLESVEFEIVVKADDPFFD